MQLPISTHQIFNAQKKNTHIMVFVSLLSVIIESLGSTTTLFSLKIKMKRFCFGDGDGDRDREKEQTLHISSNMFLNVLLSVTFH